ncbi:unnamed protein product, partial [Musa hybrid cultivar]
WSYGILGTSGGDGFCEVIAIDRSRITILLFLSYYSKLIFFSYILRCLLRLIIIILNRGSNATQFILVQLVVLRCLLRIIIIILNRVQLGSPPSGNRAAAFEVGGQVIIAPTWAMQVFYFLHFAAVCPPTRSATGFPPNL